MYSICRYKISFHSLSLWEYSLWQYSKVKRDTGWRGHLGLAALRFTLSSTAPFHRIFLTLITPPRYDHSEWAGVCVCVCVCVFVCSSAITSWQRGLKKPEERTESECRDCCSLTDVIPNTAPKCSVPPQILSEGLFKKQPHTTGLLCALFLIYSQHKFKAASRPARSRGNLRGQTSRLYSQWQTWRNITQMKRKGGPRARQSQSNVGSIFLLLGVERNDTFCPSRAFSVS